MMKFAVYFMPILWVLSPAVFCNEPEGLEACHRMTDSDQRLACWKSVIKSDDSMRYSGAGGNCLSLEDMIEWEGDYRFELNSQIRDVCFGPISMRQNKGACTLLRKSFRDSKKIDKKLKGRLEDECSN